MPTQRQCPCSPVAHCAVAAAVQGNVTNERLSAFCLSQRDSVSASVSDHLTRIHQERGDVLGQFGSVIVAALSQRCQAGAGVARTPARWRRGRDVAERNAALVKEGNRCCDDLCFGDQMLQPSAFACRLVAMLPHTSVAHRYLESTPFWSEGIRPTRRNQRRCHMWCGSERGQRRAPVRTVRTSIKPESGHHSHCGIKAHIGEDFAVKKAQCLDDFLQHALILFNNTTITLFHQTDRIVLSLSASLITSPLSPIVNIFFEFVC